MIFADLISEYFKIDDPYQGYSESWKAVTPVERLIDPLIDDLVRDRALDIIDAVKYVNPVFYFPVNF